MSLYRKATDNEEIHWQECGARMDMVIPVEIDYENPVTYLHATIWSLRNDWEADRPMPGEDELQHWVERIIALGIEGGDE